MAQAKVGDTVRIQYTGFLDDFTAFDSTDSTGPLEFTLGKEMVIPGFEKTILEMNEGDTKRFSVPPQDAYGHYMQSLVAVVNKSQIPPNITPYIGMMLELRDPDGTTAHVYVKDVADSTITIDGNHPLAGKNLTFEIKLVEIV